MSGPRIALSLLLFAAVAGLYSPSVRHEFVHYDDYAYVVDNPRTRSDGGPAVLLARATEPALANWNPLTTFSFQLEHAAHGLSSAGVHATNVALHALATSLLFLALSSLTGATWPPALVAAVFGLHPLHVESVAWAAERKDVLCAVFWMLTLWTYAIWARRPSAGRYIALASSLALALLAKPMAVTLPFVLLLLDLWPLERLTPALLRRRLIEKAPLFAMSFGISIVTYRVQQSAGAVESLERLPLLARLANAADAYVAYLLDSIWPVGLAAFYPQIELPVWRALACLIALVAITAGVLVQRRVRPHLLVGWFWFVGTLVPVIGLVQVGLQARADRYMYLPQIGLTLALVWTLAELPRRWPATRVPAAAGALAMLLALALGTHQQLAHWRNTEALFERAIAVAPDNYFAHRGLADAYLRDERFDEALAHYGDAARLKPGWSVPEVGIADILVRQGEVEQALVHFDTALEREPDLPRALVGSGLALLRLDRFDEAESQLEKALTIYAASGLLGGRGGPPHFGLARIAASRSDLSQEIAHYEAGLRYSPTSDRYRVDLGHGLVRAGRLEEAERQFRLAAQAGIDNPELRAGQGLVAEQSGRLAEAVSQYRGALAGRPDWPGIQNNLAWILATASDASLRDPVQAFDLALAAADATQYSDPGVLDTLAAAHAAKREFPDAVSIQRRAIVLAAAADDPALLAELERHLALYEAGLPYAPPAAR